VHRVGESEFDEGFEIAGEVADVLATLLGRELDGVDAKAGGAHALNGVGELNFAALVGFDAADFVENTRGKDIAAGDREAAGSVFGARFFDQMSDADGVVFDARRRDDAVLAGFGERHLFHGDDAGGGIFFEDVDHARNGLRFGVEAEDGIAESDDEGLVSGEMFAGEQGVAQSFGRSLARVEELRFGDTQIEVILNGRLVAAGDEQNLLNAVGGELVDDIFDDGLARYRKHFLGLRTSGGQETRAEAGYGNYSASNHVSPIRIHEWAFRSSRKRGASIIFCRRK